MTHEGEAHKILLESSAADLQESFRVLGSFEPFSMYLTLNFEPGHSASSFNRDSFSLKQFLTNVPIAVLTHEFAHFIQGATTAHGLRRFFLGLDHFQLQSDFLGKAAGTAGGKLRVPVIPHLAEYWTENIPDSVLMSLLLSRTISLYIGGFRVPTQMLQSQKSPNAKEWLIVQNKVRICGIVSKLPVFFADLQVINGMPQAVALGARHLEEAFATAVELVRRHLSGESGQKADPAGSITELSATQRQFADPYFVIHMICANMARQSDVDTSLEEICAVIDLALMLDPLVLSRSTKHDLRQFSDCYCVDAQNGEYNPFNAFVSLFAAYCQCHKRLPKFHTHWSQVNMVAFQNALMREAGFSSSVLDLTIAALNFCEWAFEQYKNQMCVPPNLFSMYHDVFMDLLTWRRDSLHGGGVLEDFFTDVATLHTFILQSVPAIFVGGMVFSPRGGFREGEGVGVDISNLFQFRDLIEALMHGSRRCPFDVNRPWSCVVPQYRLCKQIPNLGDTNPRCVREQALNVMFSWLGITGIEW